MTKGKKVAMEESSGWLDTPRTAKGHRMTMGVGSCSYCDEPFTFFNGRKSCEFCGATVHSKCLRTVRTAIRKAKMCLKCYQYKYDYSNMLMQGDEFICYNGQLPAASYLYLSEERGSITIVVDPIDEPVEILLSNIIHVQKGFSHAGHMRAGDQYSPIKCFSMTVVQDDRPYNYDLKAHSALHCQQWVTALNLALYVYKLVEQDDTQSLEGLPALKKRSLFSTGAGNRNMAKHQDLNREDGEKEWSNESALVISTSDYCISSDDIVVVDVNSRETTPTIEVTDHDCESPIVHTSHYKIRTIPSPYRPLMANNAASHRSPQPFRRDLSCTLSDWSVKTVDSTRSLKSSTMTVGLPYKGVKNPLATYCSCHAYAIEPPTGMLFPATSIRQVDPFSSCCVLCRDKCRLVGDLTNF